MNDFMDHRIRSCNFCCFQEENKCHRYPPMTGAFPDAKDWCGEFRVDHIKVEQSIDDVEKWTRFNTMSKEERDEMRREDRNKEIADLEKRLSSLRELI